MVTVLCLPIVPEGGFFWVVGNVVMACMCGSGNDREKVGVFHTVMGTISRPRM